MDSIAPETATIAHLHEEGNAWVRLQLSRGESVWRSLCSLDIETGAASAFVGGSIAPGDVLDFGSDVITRPTGLYSEVQFTLSYLRSGSNRCALFRGPALKYDKDAIAHPSALRLTYRPAGSDYTEVYWLLQSGQLTEESVRQAFNYTYPRPFLAAMCDTAPTSLDGQQLSNHTIEQLPASTQHLLVSAYNEEALVIWSRRTSGRDVPHHFRRKAVTQQVHMIELSGHLAAGASVYLRAMLAAREYLLSQLRTQPFSSGAFFCFVSGTDVTFEQLRQFRWKLWNSAQADVPHKRVDADYLLSWLRGSPNRYALIGIPASAAQRTDPDTMPCVWHDYDVVFNNGVVHNKTAGYVLLHSEWADLSGVQKALSIAAINPLAAVLVHLRGGTLQRGQRLTDGDVNAVVTGVKGMLISAYAQQALIWWFKDPPTFANVSVGTE